MARNPAGLRNESPGQSGHSPDPDDAGRPDEPLDLAGALRIVEEAERSTRRQLGGNTALVYLVWGLTWLVGYGALDGSRRGWLPLEPAAALTILGVALALALVSTVVLSTRGNRGIRGPSAFQGGMYGAAWGLGFLIMGILSGGTTFNDRRQSYLGVWLLLVAVAALMAGPDDFLAVFLYLGSGGLLAGSLAEYLATRRRNPAVPHA